MIENVTCPLCDGPMTPRTSAHGKFWGCKAYPKCKGTRNAEGESRRRDPEDEDGREAQDNMPSKVWADRDRRRW